MELKQWACSGIEVNTVHYEWQVKNFSRRTAELGEDLASPKFYSGTGKKEEWQIALYLGGRELPKKDYIAIYLQRISVNRMMPVNVEVQFSVKNPQTNMTFCNFFVNQQIKDEFCGTPMFILRSVIRKEKEIFLRNDTLTICCDLEIHVNKSYVSKLDKVITKAERKVNQQRLGADLKSFFKAMGHSDITIIVRTERFPAHKVILAARSSVFSAMFCNAVEQGKHEVEIKNLAPKVVEGMLYYIYADEIIDDSTALDLLPAAEKYKLQGLKSLCELSLLRILNENNAARILEYADLYDAEDLKTYVIYYIAAHETNVARTDAFESLKNTRPSLVAELYGARLKELMNREDDC